jgi:hypothetical protein
LGAYRQVGQSDERRAVMTKCQHKNADYWEWLPRGSKYVFRNGEIADSCDSDYGDISRFVNVKCHDCGLDKQYNTFSKKCPQWVKNMQEQIENTPPSEMPGFYDLEDQNSIGA